jgi:putative DNA primase/helicase
MVMHRNQTGEDLDALRAALRERAADLAILLVGHPNRLMSSKRQLRFGNKGSLSVEISGAKAGLWYDHESSEGGDLFSLIMRVWIRRCQEIRAGFRRHRAFAT